MVSNNIFGPKINVGVPLNNFGGKHGIDQLTKDNMNWMSNMKVVSKKVEIVTKITCTYEDGSTKVVIVTQNEHMNLKNRIKTIQYNTYLLYSKKFNAFILGHFLKNKP